MKKLLLLLAIFIPFVSYSQTLIGTWHDSMLDMDFPIKEVCSSGEIRMYVPSSSGDFQIVIPKTKREEFCNWLKSQNSLFKTYCDMYKTASNMATTMSGYDACRGCWITKDGKTGVLERIFIESIYANSEKGLRHKYRVEAYDPITDLETTAVFEISYLEVVKLSNIFIFH